MKWTDKQACWKLTDMYAALLEMNGVGADSGEDSSIMDTFDYIRISLRMSLQLIRM